jgi:glycosyltransferase involved in cell wall biosynthesis
MLRQPKRPDVLVEVARKAPNIRFVVCGGFTEFATPKGYAEQVVDELRMLPNVDFLGQVPPKKAQEVIANAAVLLSTSDEEGFPNVFSQAWSSGTPVVTLKLDPDRLIERMGLGAVSGNIAGVIEDITALLNSIERREEIRIRACRLIEEKHNAAAVVTLFERALQAID